MTILLVKVLLAWDRHWMTIHQEDEICETLFPNKSWECQRRWAHHGWHCHRRTVVEDNGDRTMTWALWRNPAGSSMLKKRTTPSTKLGA